MFSKKISIIVLTALLGLLIFSISCTDSGATVIGLILGENSIAIYGAKVDIDGNIVETSQDGSFTLEGIGVGSRNIIITAYGYSVHAEEVSLSAGENDLGSITIESNNSQLLSEIGNLYSSNEVTTAMEYNGFLVANDTSISKAYADAHINSLVDLIALYKSVTIGQIALDLAAQGVELNGSPITASGLVEILQALVNAGYQREGDPRLFLPLYLVSNSDGSLPSTAPTLSSYTLLTSPRATALYAALIFLAEHPMDSISISQTYSSLQEDILGSLSNMPLPPDTSDYESFIAQFGTDYLKVGGAFAGSLIGLGIGCELAGGLSLNTAGVEVLYVPFIIEGDTISDDILGCKLALWLYKIQWNRVGDDLTEEEAEDILLVEGGDIGFSSDIRVKLNWEGGELTDVDLHVTDPNAEECYFGNMITAIGGELDVDDLDGYGPENFRLQPGEAIAGTYQIEVNYYSDEGTPGEPVDATVKIYLNEGTSEEVTQELGPYQLTAADAMGTDPNAWWIVASIDWPSGTITTSNLTKKSKVRGKIPPK